MKVSIDILFCIVALVVASFMSPQRLAGDELKELQGKWELRFQENGKTLKAIKTIDGNTETVETYDGNQIVHRHVVTLEAIETDDVCVIRYGESTVTDGPRKGQRGKPGSFVSKRFKNKWYNIGGLRASEEFPPSVTEFTRILDDKK
jgi:hypothetical protein